MSNDRIIRLSDNSYKFTIHPVATGYGIKYIVKEHKLFGKYLKLHHRGYAFTCVVKESATKWSNIENINNALSDAFGGNFTIVDNYL